MAWRASLGLIALLSAGGCAYAPAFTQGPPYGEDLVAEHHDPFPAASEREARFVLIRQFGSQPRCEAHLRGIGEIVRLSSYETVAHRTIAHDGRPVVEEHHCAQRTLKVRAWFERESAAEAAHH